jgi:hypothetical protein
VKKSVPIRKRSVKEELLLLEIKAGLADLNAQLDSKEKGR